MGRILFIAYFQGPKLGVGEVMDNLLAEVSRNYRDITILTNNNTKEKTAFSEFGCNVVSSRWLSSSVLSIIYFLFLFSFTRLYRRHARVVFLSNPVIGFRNRKSISVIHDMNEFVVENKYGVVRSIYRKIVLRYSIKASLRIIVISNYVKSQIVSFVGDGYSAKIDVIYNGVINSDKRLSCSERSNYFIVVGRVDPLGKNLYELVNLFIKFNVNEQYKLLFIGGINDSTRNEAEAFLRYLNQYDNISYLGYISKHEKELHYLSCRGLFLFSKYEGFGLPLIEAYSYGCPVVTNVENEVFKEIGGGLDCSVSVNLSSDEVVDKIEEYLNSLNPSRMVEFSKNFSWTSSAKEYLRVILNS